MCGLGRLYSKQNVIEQLLEKDKMPESAKHIKNMKDIKQLSLTPNPAFTEEDKSEGLLDTRHAPYICKLIGLEMTGKFRFIALWSCGCVMSERALKQIKSAQSVCPLCQNAFSVEDVIVLNGNEEDVELAEAKMEMRAAKRKAGKKDKKEKKQKSPEKLAVVKQENENELTNMEDNQPTTSKAAAVTTQTKTATSNGMTKKSAKIVANPKRLGAANDDAMQDPELKRLKTDYCVSKDPKATDVYKSLFTSHKSEKDQERAHWVTYNPFYN